MAPEHLPLKLELWRRYRNLTQIELAEKAGVTQRTISLLETKDQVPIARTVQRLAKALECDPSELYFSPLEVATRERRS